MHHGGVVCSTGVEALTLKSQALQPVMKDWRLIWKVVFGRRETMHVNIAVPERVVNEPRLAKRGGASPTDTTD